MAHLSVNLPERVEIGAVRVNTQDGLEIVRQDNLRTVRNSRVDVEPRRWEVSLPTVNVEGDTADYDAVRSLWLDSERGLHTFNFADFIEGDTCKVRFASELTITASAGHLRHVDTFTLEECDE